MSSRALVDRGRIEHLKDLPGDYKNMTGQFPEPKETMVSVNCQQVSYLTPKDETSIYGMNSTLEMPPVSAEPLLDQMDPIAVGLRWTWDRSWSSFWSMTEVVFVIVSLMLMVIVVVILVDACGHGSYHRLWWWYHH